MPTVQQTSIPVSEFITLHRADTYVVDVRESDEYAAGHIAGARHVQLSSLPWLMDTFPTDRRIYVICRSGPRSEIAVEQMNRSGLHAVCIEGGMRAWIAAGQHVRVGADA